MSATAIGTGINVPKGYPEKCAAHLAKLTGKPIVPASDMLAATWDQQGFVVYSSALRSVTIKLSKIANDAKLLPEVYGSPVSGTLRSDIHIYYSDTGASFVTRKDPKAWQNVLDELGNLKDPSVVCTSQ